MANQFTQYLKDTRGELRHVAWPTRLQTIVYSSLVAAISVGIAIYLGLFDFLFTTGLKQFLSALPAQQQTQQQTPAAASSSDTATPTSPLPLKANLPL